MDGMADYVRAPTRIFPDAAEIDMAFLNGEKARSLGLHPLVPPQQHPFAAGAHPTSPRLPPMPLATIQQHLFALQQRAIPPMTGSGQPMLPLPFPHGFLSQWTLAAAAGFGLNQLGLFGLGGLPPSASSSTSPPQQLSPQNAPLESANLKASTSPGRHRFSPYPVSSKVSESVQERPPSAKSVLDVSK